MPEPPTDPTAPATLDDVEQGLRFLHLMGMQTKLDVADAIARLTALTEELIARGVVGLRTLDERMDKARRDEGKRVETQATVQVAPTIDKYAVESPPVDCAALMPICKGRCCRLSFPLSFQDLDEAAVRWDYRNPYLIRQGADGFCVHSDPARRACTVYEQRPAVCRTYDCRTDKRIWADYEQRIPAADDAIPLVKIRARPR